MRSTYEKYCTTKTRYKYHEIMKQLSINKAIFILKQDKGRGVVTMNQSKYFEKFVNSIKNTVNVIRSRPNGYIGKQSLETLRKRKSKMSKTFTIELTLQYQFQEGSIKAQRYISCHLMT